MTLISPVAYISVAFCLLPCMQVNEYTRGVGLAPHIDTHVAFEGIVLSLSVSGPCIMEFRRPMAAVHSSHDTSAAQNRHDSSASQGGQNISAVRDGHNQESLTSGVQTRSDSPAAENSPDASAVQQLPEHTSDSASTPAGVGEKERNTSGEAEQRECDGGTGGQIGNAYTSEGEDRKPLFLPPKSLLVLSGEARYAWSHYIPNHKVSRRGLGLKNKGEWGKYVSLE